MKAGHRKHRIVIERASITRNGLNEPIKTWETFCAEMAAVYYGSGREQREGAQTQASQAASFEVLSNSRTRAVSVKDRINFGGGLWDIHSVAPIDGGGVKINATRAVG